MLSLGVHRIAIDRQPGLADLSAIRSVRAHASKLDLDVIHGHGAKGGLYARAAAFGLRAQGQKVRSFYTPHGGSLNYKPGSLEQRILLTVERGLESISSGLIFESAFAEHAYGERVRTKGAPRRVIPNGVKPADFTLNEPSPDATDVLFVGELRHIKGVDVLLKALSELNRERNVTATITGSGPDDKKLRSMADVLGLGTLVTFTGALPVREAFRRGRILVVPSRAESLPYIVLEAAAAGMPLIATNVGGIPEIVAGTETTLIEADDVAALASAINNALADPEAAANNARHLRETIRGRFSVAAMADSVLDFYAEVSPVHADASDCMTLQGRAVNSR
jgi:glycosyltransferase involved in cell wall biosynthesis